ncbi:MAG: ABC transporter permease [Lachnospiraceae bacterium]|nr:ABC transporter permease [Lachnospiraceae bacterium]
MAAVTKEDFVFVNKDKELSSVDLVIFGDTFLKTSLKRFFSKKANILGLVLLIMLFLLAIFVPLLSPFDFNSPNIKRADMAPRIPGLASGTEYLPGTQGKIVQNKYEELGLNDTYYLFGTDGLGRDLFSRCFAGLRVSLFIAIVAAIVNLIIGMNYGIISGYMGGRWDFIMQKIVDIMGSIPTLIIVTLLMLVLKPGIGSIIIALMLTGWMEMSMVARAKVLELKEREYILAARTLGANGFYIITKELMPNIISIMITQLMVTIPDAIFLETFLSFVGLGLPVGSCSLGRIISDGFESCLLHPYKLFPAVIILVILMIASNLVADGLKEAFDTGTR